jgi:hypothetical protein
MRLKRFDSSEFRIGLAAALSKGSVIRVEPMSNHTFVTIIYELFTVSEAFKVVQPLGSRL